MHQADLTLRRLRHVLLALFVLGVAGTLAELLLIAHDEDAAQLIPVALVAVALPVAAWNMGWPSRWSVRVLQALMPLFVVAGLAGVVYHYDANVEFQQEVDPLLSGTALLWKVLQAKAPPALSPGIMVQLGLLGLAYAFRHPALSSQSEGEDR